MFIYLFAVLVLVELRSCFVSIINVCKIIFALVSVEQNIEQGISVVGYYFGLVSKPLNEIMSINLSIRFFKFVKNTFFNYFPTQLNCKVFVHLLHV